MPNQVVSGRHTSSQVVGSKHTTAATSNVKDCIVGKYLDILNRQVSLVYTTAYYLFFDTLYFFLKQGDMSNCRQKLSEDLFRDQFRFFHVHAGWTVQSLYVNFLSFAKKQEKYAVFQIWLREELLYPGRSFRIKELYWHAAPCYVRNHAYIPYSCNFFGIHFKKRFPVSVNRPFPKFILFIFIGCSNFPEEIVPRWAASFQHQTKDWLWLIIGN